MLQMVIKTFSKAHVSVVSLTATLRQTQGDNDANNVKKLFNYRSACHPELVEELL